MVVIFLLGILLGAGAMACIEDYRERQENRRIEQASDALMAWIGSAVRVQRQIPKVSVHRPSRFITLRRIEEGN